MRNQKFFRARVRGGLWNEGTSIKILSKTPEKEVPDENLEVFFLLDTLKTIF